MNEQEYLRIEASYQGDAHGLAKEVQDDIFVLLEEIGRLRKALRTIRDAKGTPAYCSFYAKQIAREILKEEE